MALALLTSQKAKITVDLDDGAGNLTPQPEWHYAFADTAVANLLVTSAGAFVVAQGAGETNLHITTMDGTVATDVTVTVTLDETAPVPALVVTFGDPQPK